jgi:hypothetical protein
MIEIIYDDGGVLSAFGFDATTDERHTASAKATEHQVERGVNIVDHVRPDRRDFEIEVTISDTPVGQDHEGLTRVVDTWAQLLDVRDRALLCTITTRIETLENMALISAETVLTAADGTWITCRLLFAEVRLVSTEFVDDPVPTRTRDRRQVSRGSETTEEPTPVVQEVIQQSFARILEGPVRSFFGGGS